jgi:ABC-type phosphate transport system ATPase subunit
MSKPTHIAYVVTDSKEGTDKKAMWREVGAVWPHKNGNGFDVVIYDQVSVGGRIVYTERKDKAADDKPAA